MLAVSSSPLGLARLCTAGMNRNTSQDPDYEGLPGHEKKFHKTHFGVLRTLKNRIPPEDDPEWVYIGVGRWRRIPQKRDKRRESAEVQRGIPRNKLNSKHSE